MKNKKIKIKIVVPIAILFIIAIVIIVTTSIFIKEKKNNNEQQTANENGVYELPDTTYSDMKVTNIQMEYLKENNETMVSMNIYNNTNKKCENERLIAVLIDNDGQIIRTNRNIYTRFRYKSRV